MGLRPYEIGDDVRDLDWATTVRFDRPYVRVYRREVEDSLLLFIDASASMGFGDPSKLAYAQALACALGYLALARHDRVGAVSFTDAAGPALPAARGGGQWNALRDFVEALRPGGLTEFTGVSQALARLREHRGLAVILSDFDPPERFERGLRLLAKCPVTAVALHILSPQELDPELLEPALEGEVELVDPETGETRAGFIGSAERAGYRQALQRLSAHVADMCNESGIRSVRLSSGLPVLRCLQGPLVQAGVLGRETS